MFWWAFKRLKPWFWGLRFYTKLFQKFECWWKILRKFCENFAKILRKFCENFAKILQIGQKYQNPFGPAEPSDPLVMNIGGNEFYIFGNLWLKTKSLYKDYYHSAS